MLTLHGFPYSNYHNIVKHAIMHKGIPFQEHIVYPNTPEMRAVNPTGKVPAMTTDSGVHLSESSVLVEYLEEFCPESPLLPADPELRGSTRQIMKIAELYLDLPARRLLPALIGNTEAPASIIAEVNATIDRAVRSLQALGKFSPYVMGAEITLADLYLRYTLSIAKMVAPEFLGRDVPGEVPGLAAWDKMMSESDIAKSIDADQAANAEEFMAVVSAQLKGRKDKN